MKNPGARWPNSKSRHVYHPTWAAAGGKQTRRFSCFLPPLLLKMTAGIPAPLSLPAPPSAWIRGLAENSWTWGEWGRSCMGPWNNWCLSITVGRYASFPRLLTGSLSAEHPLARAGRRRVATACPWAAGERYPWYPPTALVLSWTPHHARCFLHRESVEGSGRTGSSPFLPFSWFTDSGKGSASSGSTTSPTCSPKHEGFSPKKSASQVSPGLYSFFFSFPLSVQPSFPSFFFP